MNETAGPTRTRGRDPSPHEALQTTALPTPPDGRPRAQPLLIAPPGGLSGQGREAGTTFQRCLSVQNFPGHLGTAPERNVSLQGAGQAVNAQKEAGFLYEQQLETEIKIYHIQGTQV